MAIKRAPIRFTGRWPSDQHGPGPALHRGQQQQADHQRDGRAAVLQIRIPSNVAALWSLGRGRLRAHHCQQVLPGRGTSKKKTVSVFFHRKNVSCSNASLPFQSATFHLKKNRRGWRREMNSENGVQGIKRFSFASGNLAAADF